MSIMDVLDSLNIHFEKRKITLSKFVFSPGIALDGILYLTTDKGTITISHDDFKETFIPNEYYFVRDSKIMWYKHLGERTYFLDYCLEGRGKIYPNVNDIFIFHYGTYSRLLF